MLAAAKTVPFTTLCILVCDLLTLNLVACALDPALIVALLFVSRQSETRLCRNRSCGRICVIFVTCLCASFFAVHLFGVPNGIAAFAARFWVEVYRVRTVEPSIDAHTKQGTVLCETTSTEHWSSLFNFPLDCRFLGTVCVAATNFGLLTAPPRSLAAVAACEAAAPSASDWHDFAWRTAVPRLSAFAAVRAISPA